MGEYIWLENGRIQIHNFGSSESGESPFGSPNFWGAGSGTPENEKTSEKKEVRSFERSVGGNAERPGQTLRELLSGQSQWNTQRGSSQRDSWGEGSWGQDSWGDGSRGDSWRDGSWGERKQQDS